jgi:hypothetical protein
MRGCAMTDQMTLGEAARVMRDAVGDKSYQVTPLGEEIANYLHVKRKRLTASSHRDYESGLDKLARHFPDLRLEDFEPPAGTERLEEFLDLQWGGGAPRTYNKNLSIVKDFFQWQIRRGRLHGDPTLLIERAKSRQVYRTTFTTDQRHAIVAEQSSRRDRIALRLAPARLRHPQGRPVRAAPAQGGARRAGSPRSPTPALSEGRGPSAAPRDDHRLRRRSAGPRKARLFPRRLPRAWGPLVRIRSDHDHVLRPFIDSR